MFILQGGQGLVCITLLQGRVYGAYCCFHWKGSREERREGGGGGEEKEGREVNSW